MECVREEERCSEQPIFRKYAAALMSNQMEERKSVSLKASQCLAFD